MWLSAWHLQFKKLPEGRGHGDSANLLTHSCPKEDFSAKDILTYLSELMKIMVTVIEMEP